MTKLFDLATTTVVSRVRSWARSRHLSVGNKRVHRDPGMLSPAVVEWIALGHYEEPERKLLDYMHRHGKIGNGDRVIEAGGGLGVMTMHIADIVGDAAILVFEPNPRTAKALRANLALNGHRIKVEEAALSATPSGQELCFIDVSEIDHFAKSGLQCNPNRGRKISVRAQSLSDAINRFDASILVLDVEGAEHDILVSVDDWKNVRSIHLEIHPRILSPDKVKAMLERLGEFGFGIDSVPALGSDIVLLTR